MEPTSKEDINEILLEINDAFKRKMKFFENEIKNVEEVVALKKHNNDDLIKYLLNVLEMLKNPMIEEKEI
jgi:hypothetical protein